MHPTPSPLPTQILSCARTSAMLAANTTTLYSQINFAVMCLSNSQSSTSWKDKKNFHHQIKYWRANSFHCLLIYVRLEVQRLLILCGSHSHIVSVCSGCTHNPCGRRNRQTNDKLSYVRIIASDTMHNFHTYVARSASG